MKKDQSSKKAKFQNIYQKIVQKYKFQLLLISLVLFFITLIISITTRTIWQISVFAILAIFAMYAAMGWKDFITNIFYIFVISAFINYSKFLQEQISGRAIVVTDPVFGQFFLILVISFIFIFGQYIFPSSLKRFLSEIKEMMSYQGIRDAIINLFVSYIGITVIFGVLYASIYLFLGKGTFSPSKDLQFFDFIYFSLFVPITLGLPDLSPQHWLAKLLTLLELGFGIVVFIIYLGVIVSKISEYMSHKQKQRK